MTPERLAELRARPDLIDSDEGEVTWLLKCVDLLHETTAILKEHLAEESTTIPMPQNEAQAKAMILLGEAWLRNNPPSTLCDVWGHDPNCDTKCGVDAGHG